MSTTSTLTTTSAAFTAPSPLADFVTSHFFALQRAANSAHPNLLEEETLRSAWVAAQAGLPGDAWRDSLSSMEELVGSPVAQWHAGHLAQLQGETLPAWDKQKSFIDGFGKTQRLEELQRQAAATLSEMKYALVREMLTRHAQLHEPDVQTRMRAFLRELGEKSRSNPIVFLEHLAHRRFAPSLFSAGARPSAEWAKKEKSTELVCQLANLTLLELHKSLQVNNDGEQKNDTPCNMDDVSMR